MYAIEVSRCYKEWCAHVLHESGLSIGVLLRDHACPTCTVNLFHSCSPAGMAHAYMQYYVLHMFTVGQLHLQLHVHNMQSSMSGA